MDKLKKKLQRRSRIKQGIRKKLRGSASQPRLSVYRSNREIYAQVIDDDSGHTLVAASSKDAEIQEFANRIEQAKKVGALVAQRAKDSKIEKVVFDRNGYLFHGRVKALADGAKEGGLNF